MTGISHCQKRTRAQIIKFKQNGKKARFKNEDKRQFIRTQVDKCAMPKDLPAADYLLSRRDYCDIIIELKGSDVGHGLKQVESTAGYFLENKLFVSKHVAALIVTTGCSPKFSSTIQKARQTFKDKFKLPLHVLTGSRVHDIETLLTFKGPDKI